jgi:hypothetical protein
VLFAMENGHFDRMCYISHDLVNYRHGLAELPPF